jgi:hypothetical protein
MNLKKHRTSRRGIIQGVPGANLGQETGIKTDIFRRLAQFLRKKL